MGPNTLSHIVVIVREHGFVIRCKLMCEAWASILFSSHDTLVLQKGLIHRGIYWCVMKHVCHCMQLEQFCVHEEANFDLCDRINISSFMWLVRKGLLLCSKNSLCENNACTYVLTIVNGNLCMMLELSCSYNQSSYFSWIFENWVVFILHLVFIALLAYLRNVMRV